MKRESDQLPATPASDLAALLFETYGAYSKADWSVYERLCEIFGDKAIADNSHDEYDSSLEIYADDDALVPTREQANAVLAMGFAKFWINYRDETEIIVTASHIGERRKRSYPKWNDKERKRTPRSESAAPDYEGAVEAARCAYINLNNMVKMMPALRSHPLLPLMKAQLRQAIEAMGDKDFYTIEDGQ